MGGNVFVYSWLPRLWVFMPDSPDSQNSLDGEQDKTTVSAPLSPAGNSLHHRAIIDGIYEIEREIGSGGAGSVYQVKQRLLEKTFALKILHDTYSETAMLRFQNEAKIAASLDHPNLVRAFHSGVLPDGKPFYVMDLIAGMTLAEHLEKGPLRPPEVIDIFLPLCLALDYAHARGLVHRDVKPGNTVLTIEDGKIVPKIIDFGIAHLALSEGVKGAGLTRTGEIFGTPKYMSPEQCLSKKVDQRSDIYSLGCMMYECLTGKVPFMGENGVATSMLHVTAQPQALRDALPSRQFQRGWQEIIDQMLAKDPADRFQSCAQVAHALEAVRDNTVELPVKRKPVVPPKPPKQGIKPAAIAMIVGVVLLATVGGVALLKLNYTDDNGGNSKKEIDAQLPASMTNSSSMHDVSAQSSMPTASAPIIASEQPTAYLGSVASAPPIKSAAPSATAFLPTSTVPLNPFALIKKPKPPKPSDDSLRLTALKFPYSERIFQQALAAAQNGDWVKAMTLGSAAAKDMKKSATAEDAAALSLRNAFVGLALSNLPNHRLQRSELFGASIWLSWAIDQDPYVGEYFAIRSHIYSAMGQEREAAEDSREAERLAATPTECDRILRKVNSFADAQKKDGLASYVASKIEYGAAKQLVAERRYKEAVDTFKSLFNEAQKTAASHGVYDQKQCSLYQAFIAYALYRQSDAVKDKSLLENALNSIETAISYNGQPAEFYHIKSMILKRLAQTDKAQEADDIFVEKNRENANPEINEELRKIIYDSQPAK